MRHNARSMKSPVVLLLLAALVLSLSAGCSDDTAAAPTGLECAVEDVVVRNCQQCHQAEPRFGAPMPLVTQADLMAPAASDASLTVWEMMQLRIHDEVSPMPPSGLMNVADLGVLDRYIGLGLPQHSEVCESMGGTVPDGETPADLPCDVTHTFLANGGGVGAETPYALPPATGNRIQCFVFDSPFEAGSQGVGFSPVIDDQRVVHHWILWSTAEDIPAGTSFDCTNDMPADAQFIDGWAPGGGNNVPPESVGIELPGAGEKLLMQIHYWNVAGHEDVLDRTGVALCATDGPTRAQTAAISTLGSLAIAIPPRTDEWSTSSDCTPNITEPVQILGTGPHMHTLGTKLRTEVLRGGDPSDVEMLTDVQDWDFNSQSGMPATMTIRPGDVLRTTCTYRNPSDSFVYFGDRTEDEMCFNFVLAYPAGALANGFGADRGFCIDGE